MLKHIVMTENFINTIFLIRYILLNHLTCYSSSCCFYNIKNSSCNFLELLPFKYCIICATDKDGGALINRCTDLLEHYLLLLLSLLHYILALVALLISKQFFPLILFFYIFLSIQDDIVCHIVYGLFYASFHHLVLFYYFFYVLYSSP